MNEFAKRRTWGPTPRYPLVEAYEPPKRDFVVIAGPCSVENESQIRKLAFLLSDADATHLRGGVFRAGTYPGNNFGYVEAGLLGAYSSAAYLNFLQNIIEVLDYSANQLEKISKYCTCFQVGARSMQNYTLLRSLGHYGKPVFLKRHPGATLDEWLGAAEHVLTGGVKELYLIERGSSTHANHVRWDLSISMIPAVKAITKIPVIVDASHGTGRRDLVEPMTLAGVAAGAGGLLVEVHEDPSNSLSDPDQAITPEAFQELMVKVNKVREAIK
jgi:3-deoxy-7-phosphoheptulonate synthase